MPDHVYTVNERCSREHYTGADFFLDSRTLSTVENRVDIGTGTIEMNSRREKVGKEDRLSFRHTNPRLRAYDTYLGNSYENPMKNRLWRRLYELYLPLFSFIATVIMNRHVPSTRSLCSLG